jgi:hydroxymethylpyrimidine/phosphomethylpyrimidine kinase
MSQAQAGAQGRVLIIAGSDSGGGAGVQADIKAVSALGGYAMTAITAITVQNTMGVFAVAPVAPEIIRGQIQAVIEDLGVDAIKIGMLGTAETVALVAEGLDAFAPGVPVVLDPVMVAKGGHALLAQDAVAAVRELLVGRAALVTPNAPEAEALTGLSVATAQDQAAAGAALLRLGAQAALVKGGHLEADPIADVLVLAGQAEPLVLESPRIVTRATHGTGCTLSSAIAARLALGDPLEQAVRAARDYLRGAILNAPGFGKGYGPLGHMWMSARTTE